MTSRAFVLSGVPLAAAIPAAAQSPGTFEIGGFGRYTKYDDTLSSRRQGRRRWHAWHLRHSQPRHRGRGRVHQDQHAPAWPTSRTRRSADGSRTTSRWAATPAPSASARAMCTTDTARTRTSDEDGVTGLLGLRVGLGEKFALQVDGTIDYGPSPADFRTPPTTTRTSVSRAAPSCCSATATTRTRTASRTMSTGARARQRASRR